MTSLLVSTPLSLSHACDEVAADLLAEAGWITTPVDAFKLARARLRSRLRRRPAELRGRFKRLAGRPTLFLSPDNRPERLQWAAAHEIGESAAWRVFERMDIDPDAAESGLREKVAAQLATAILLPRDSFDADVGRFDGDVLKLKSLYATASHELILMSQLRMNALLLASVFDHGTLTRRRTNGRLAPPPLMTLEREVQLQSHATGKPVTRTGRGVRVQAFPIHEAGWKRELLRTTPLDDEPEDLDIEYDTPGCEAE